MASSFSQASTNIEGTLAHFNFSPKGGYEALIIITKKGTVQVNFEPDEAAVLAATLKAGGKVSLKADTLHKLREEEVLSLLIGGPPRKSC